MTPPRKPTASIDATSNFFQRGKKASTTQRVVTAKVTAPSQKDSSTVAPAKKRPAKHVDQEDHEDHEDEEESDEIDDSDSSDDEQVYLHSDQDEATSEQDEEHDEHKLIDDEIQSDDSDAVAAELPKLEKPSSPKKSSSISGSGGAIKKAEVVKTKTAKTAKGAGARSNKKKDTYVAPNVGDIHVGCKLVLHGSSMDDTQRSG